MRIVKWIKSLFKKPNLFPANNNIHHPNFATIPLTNGEIRVNRIGESTEWSTRDVLINSLRDIDSGVLESEKCLIIFEDTKGEAIHRRYSGTGLDSLSLASFHIAKYN